MWRHVGIQRDQTGLEAAEHQVDFWTRYVAAREFPHPAGWELQNLLLVSKLMIVAALIRRETRGTHARRDFPLPDPQLARHITLTPAT